MEEINSVINHLAALAHLDLEPEERRDLAGQLSDILDAASRIRELDTAEIDPAAHLLSDARLLRSDEVKPSLPAGEALQNVPRCKDNLIEVPRMLKSSAE